MKYRDELLLKINKFIDKKSDFPDFAKEYYQYYLDEVPDKSLSIIEDTFFGLVQEKLDWVTENPSLEEKKHGWANNKTYYEWLLNNTKAFLKDEKKWYQNNKNFD